MTMPDQDEEQRLRDRLLKRKNERRASSENARNNNAAATTAPKVEVDDGKPNASSVASTVTATTASLKFSSPQQQDQQKLKFLGDSFTTTKNNVEPSPEGRSRRDDDDVRSTPTNNGNSSRNGGSIPPQKGSVESKNGKTERQDSARRRERHDEHRPIMNNHWEGGYGRGGPPPYDHYPRDDRYNPRYHPLYSEGRWERDFGGGGGGAAAGDGGPPPYHRRFYDDRRGPPPPPRGVPFRGHFHEDRSPPGRRREHGRHHGHHPSPSSYSSYSKQEEWSYGDSYSSKRRSRSDSPEHINYEKVEITSRSRDGRESVSRGSREGRSSDRRSDDRRSSRSASHGSHRKRYRKDDHHDGHRPPKRRGHYHSDCSDDYSSSSHSDSSSSLSSSSSSDSDSERSTKKRNKGSNRKKLEAESALSKDQRTVFVTQLVMRTTEKDIRRYFKKKVGCKVNEVILLRDRRSRTHKGCGYVQFARIEDVAKAIAVSGVPPDFQRFPILVKESEAEKNYVIPASSSIVTASMMGTTTNFTPFIDKNGKQVESQKVYIGGLDPTVTDEHLFVIFSQFGQLDKVSIQMDPATNISRGYAFLSYRDPKDANLAIQTMAGQIIAGRPMKTGWANQASSIPGVPIVTSDEFPEDSSVRVQKAFQVFAQLVGGSSEAAKINAVALSVTAEQALDAAMGMGVLPQPQTIETNSNQGASHGPSSVPTVAEARASLRAVVDKNVSAVAAAAVSAALATATTPKLIGRADNPSRHILVHNMFDKDEETDPGWEKDIEEEFLEEASKFGKVEKVVVMHTEPGGKIYASFEATVGAEACAKKLAGRWFDKRQLRVDFVDETDMPNQKHSAP